VTSPALLILLTKIVLIGDMVAIASFICDYSRLAQWWKNPVGRTIVMKDLFLLGVISLIVASVFFQFSRLTSEVASWIQIVLLGGMAAAMLWRILVFERIHRNGRRPKGGDDDSQGGSL
jgi:hypothetical protein